jgi:hypothetical protein
MLKKLSFLAVALCLPTASLATETYCQSPGLILYDGVDETIEWVVTSVQARKVQQVGQTKPTRGCSRDFRPNGLILSRVILVPAKLGKFSATSRNRVYYESEKTGVDEIAYKTTWEQNGRVSSAIVRLKVKVIAGPI